MFLQVDGIPVRQGLLAVAELQARGFGQLGKGLVLGKAGMAVINDAELQCLCIIIT